MPVGWVGVSGWGCWSGACRERWRRATAPVSWSETMRSATQSCSLWRSQKIIIRARAIDQCKHVRLTSQLSVVLIWKSCEKAILFEVKKDKCLGLTRQSYYHYLCEHDKISKFCPRWLNCQVAEWLVRTSARRAEFRIRIHNTDRKPHGCRSRRQKNKHRNIGYWFVFEVKTELEKQSP